MNKVFWINIYQSVMFGTVWTTASGKYPSFFDSKEQAIHCSVSNEGQKYIGAYKITLKEVQTA